MRIRTRIKNLIWGLAVIAVGVGFLGDKMNFWGENFVFGELFSKIWWAVLIILVGVSSLIDALSVFGVAVSAVGVYLLISRFTDRFNIGAIIVPVIIIIVGIGIIFGGRNKKHRYVKPETVSGEATAEYKCVFSGNDIKFTGNMADGISLETVFGGMSADFSACTVTNDVTLFAKTVFGGIDIILPANVNVTLSGKSALGGADSERKTAFENAPAVHIVYDCTFGGVDVK
mgnify:CR=1 FL=1